MLLAALSPTAAMADDDLFRWEVRTILFSSADLGTTPHVSMGSKRAYDGTLDESGIVFTAHAGLGGRWRRPEGFPLDRRFFQSRTESTQLVGFQIVTDTLYAAAHLGTYTWSRVADTGEPGTASMTWTVQGDLWWRPSPRSLLVVSAIARGDGPSLRLRMAGGTRVQGVYVGPEAIFAGDGEWRDVRIGLHATGLRLGPASLSLSGGAMRTERRPLGLYSTLAVDWRL